MRPSLLPLLVLGTLALPARAGETPAEFTPSAQSRALVNRLTQGAARIVRPFAGPMGLDGYVLESKAAGKQFVVFVTREGAHLIAGGIFDAQGRNLTREATARYVTSSTADQMLEQIAARPAIETGPADAPVLHVLADPHCGYCAQLWTALKPDLEAGRLRVRWVLVDFLRRDGAAARAMAADAQGRGGEYLAALYEKRPVPEIDLPDDALSAAAEQVAGNFQLMQRHGIRGTPYLIYRARSGAVQTIAGMPRNLDQVLVTLNTATDRWLIGSCVRAFSHRRVGASEGRHRDVDLPAHTVRRVLDEVAGQAGVGIGHHLAAGIAA